MLKKTLIFALSAALLAFSLAGCAGNSSDSAKASNTDSQEKTEQAALRREYIDAFKSSLRVQLDHTQVIGPDGVRRPLEKKQP